MAFNAVYCCNPAAEARVCSPIQTVCIMCGAGPQGREFTLVFRTFGADVAEVVEEMNAFATGQHPCYPEARPFDSWYPIWSPIG